VLGSRILRGSDLDRQRAVMGGDAGGDALGSLDRDGEVGAVAGAVLLDHRPQPEALGVRLGDRHADQAAAVRGEEVDLLRGDEARGEYEVALVLAILVVDQHDDLAGLDGGDDVGDGADGCGFAAHQAILLLRRFALAAGAFADAGRLAGALAQVVELGAAHFALALHLDRGDQRRVGLEGALDALARGDLAHDERGVEALVALGDHHALEGLRALALALDDVDVDDHRVAGREVGDFLLQPLDLFLLESLDQIHRITSVVRAGTRPAASFPRRSASLPPAGPAFSARSCPAPASTASAGCSRGARTSGSPAPSRLHTSPGACTAGSRAARRRTTPPPPRPRRRAPRAAAAPRRRSTPWRRARRPRGRSLRSRSLRPPACPATARPRPHIARTAK